MKTRVLEILRLNEGHWVPAEYFLRDYMYAFRSRVAELKKEHHIESRKQKNSPCYEYRYFNQI